MSKEDKENYIVRTKIPVPVPPLPGLPQHLLRRRAVRAPLHTLVGPNNGFAQNANLAGPSGEQNRFKTRKDSPLIVNSRFVNIKRSCEDSGYFKENKDDKRTSEQSAVYVRSDDNREGDEVERTNDDKPDSPRASTSTPTHHLLQPARIKKIKRSLKRPHSRELLCISPRPNQDGLDDNMLRRRLNLIFNSTTDEKIEAAGPRDLLTEHVVREYSSDILSHILQTEVKQAPPKVHNETRACVINWLMKINDGNPATIQMAIWYLDKILSYWIVSLENMQLVAAASFWIASKIEGPFVSASRIVRYSNKAFNKLNLFQTEMDILMKLKFPSLKVIPQDFLCYMALWCNKELLCDISMAASFVCLCGMMVNKRLCQEYPSVVAAASIRCALRLLRKHELIPRLQECSVFAAVEKKANGRVAGTCVELRYAVREVASQKYPYNYILKLYGSPPGYVAQKIVSAVKEFSFVDTMSAI